MDSSREWYSPIASWLFGASVLGLAIAGIGGCEAGGTAGASSDAAGHWFVSPAGNDSNPGTARQPFRTLAHAQQVVRSQLANLNGDAVVTLAAGEYRLDSPLVFTAADSPSNGHRCIYTAANGSVAVLNGGVRVTGWKQIDPSRNLWSAPAPAQLSNTRQLYVNGVRAARARGRLPVHLTQTATGYIADSDVMSRWRNPSDIEFVYTGGNALWSEPSVGLGAWTEPRCPVASIDGMNITMAQPCWDNSTRRVPLPEKFHSTRSANLVGPAHVGKEPAYVENAYELLGTPGQWYLDRQTRALYYVPRAGENLATADVEAPVLEKLIDGRGNADAPVRNLAFRGIQFSYATWLFPSTPEGFSEIQANYLVTGRDGYAVQGLGDLVPGGKQPFGDWTPTPGNICFRYDHNISFDGCVFTHLGAAGLALGDGSQDDAVRGCIFTDISGNGLTLGGVDRPMADGPAATRNDTIANNHFYDIAAEYHGGVGIDVGYVQSARIVHNQLDHLPYSGVSIGWGGWPDKIELPGVANTSHDNLIANNLVFDHLLLLADGGGIYTQGQTGPDLPHGEHVIGNVVHNQLGTGHAIYSDNGSADMTIIGNAMFNDNFDNWGSAHANYYNGNKGHTRDPFDIEDNYWQQGTPDSDRENVKLAHNHLIALGQQVPQAIVQNAGLEPAYAHLLQWQSAEGAQAPEAPAHVAAYGGDGRAYVSFTPPCRVGTAPITRYTVTSSTGQSASIPAADYQARGYVLVEHLTNGTSVHFTVTAASDSGVSPPSLQSLPIQPAARPAEPPEQPKVGAVYAGDGCISVHFSPPARDGSAPVLAYRVILQPGGAQAELAGRTAITLSGRHSTFCVVDGLKNGTAYTATVTAVTPAGKTSSDASEPVTPQAQGG